MHPPSIIEIGAIRLNVESKIVQVNGQRVHLTSKEYQLLERLALRKGMTLTKEMMLNHLYGGMDRVPKFKIIDVFICKLRRKLRTATGGLHYIETVWGRGYVLRDPAERTVTRAVRANDEGQWAIALEHRFDPGEYQFALAPKAGEGGPSPVGQRVSLQLVGAKKPPVAVVEKAAVQQESLPSPITFIYDEANFTHEGRTQAAAFAAFLRERRIATATLSGHADERGSDLYNFRLSQERLDAVVRFLREAGFSGKLVLLPMGKREPFVGANRQLLSTGEAFALDRRVELRGAQ